MLWGLWAVPTARQGAGGGAESSWADRQTRQLVAASRLQTSSSSFVTCQLAGENQPAAPWMWTRAIILPSSVLPAIIDILANLGKFPVVGVARQGGAGRAGGVESLHRPPLQTLVCRQHLYSAPQHITNDFKLEFYDTQLHSIAKYA